MQVVAYWNHLIALFSVMLVIYHLFITHWHSIVKQGGCFQWCLFVCLSAW